MKDHFLNGFAQEYVSKTCLPFNGILEGNLQIKHHFAIVILILSPSIYKEVHALIYRIEVQAKINVSTFVDDKLEILINLKNTKEIHN